MPKTLPNRRLKPSAWLIFGGLALLPALAACQGDLPDSATRGYRGQAAPNQAVNRLQGAWNAACASGGSSSATQQSSVIFVNRQVSLVTRWFDDANCSDQRKQYELTIGKTFTVSADENAATQPLATTVQVTTFAVSPSFVDEANTANACGKSDWTGSAARNVSGANCLGVSVPTVGSTSTDTVVITSNTTITYNGATYTKSN